LLLLYLGHGVRIMNLWFACLLFVVGISGQEILNIHIIPHSHCDPGWLKTFQGYHDSQVSRILTNVMNALAQNEKRKFVWAEISFFSKWYDVQPQTVRQQVERFIDSGQLEFVEGGWVQPDEANSNFDNLVYQMTEGHDYLLKMFGVRPRIGWQIDPFGHSSLTPTLASQFGFDALVINRIHHTLKSFFQTQKQMEFVWRGSPTLKERSEIFTHVLHTHYSAPKGFDWEESGSKVVTSQNVAQQASRLVKELKGRAECYRSNNLLVTFGDDFKFMNAEKQFSNMEQLIDYINQQRATWNVNIKFSTVSEYFDSVFQSKTQFTEYRGDFYPYADNEDSYWTGYYTTRPKLKRLTRSTTASLRAAESAFLLARGASSNRVGEAHWAAAYKKILQGRRDTSLVMHHDGITGTAKTFVAADYTNRLERTEKDSNTIISFMISSLLSKKKETAIQAQPFFESDELHIDDINQRGHPFLYYNSLGWKRRSFVRIKLSLKSSDFKKNINVLDGNRNPIPSQYTPYDVLGARETGLIYLNFMVEVPPLGVSTYFIVVSDNPDPKYIPTPSEIIPLRGTQTDYVENEFLKIGMRSTGLTSVENLKTGKTLEITNTLEAYSTSQSGAYIFRSKGDPSQVARLTGVTVAAGPLLTEIYISYDSKGYSQRVTLRKSGDPEIDNLVEIVHTVHADSGKEVISRYSTDLKTGTRFYTDNGIEMQVRSTDESQEPRVHISRKTVEAQYYPCVSTSFIRDDDTQQQFTVLSSSPMGVTHHSVGGLEYMMHRHLTKDDGRGLGEGVKDKTVIDVSQRLLFDSISNSEEIRRRLSLYQDHQLRQLLVIPSESYENMEWDEVFYPQYRSLQAELPPSLHLLSFAPRDAVSQEVIFRVMHIGEENKASSSITSPASILFSEIFTSDWELDHLRERSLSLTYDIEDVPKRLSFDKSLGVFHINSTMMTRRKSVSNRKMASQNSKEEGVFISDVALKAMREQAAKRMAQDKFVPVGQPAAAANAKFNSNNQPRVRRVEKGPSANVRKLNALDASVEFVFHPLEIKSFIFSMDTAHLTDSFAHQEDISEHSQDQFLLEDADYEELPESNLEDEVIVKLEPWKEELSEERKVQELLEEEEQQRLEEQREAQRLLDEEARLLEEEAQRRLEEQEREAQRRLEEVQRKLEEEKRLEKEREAQRRLEEEKEAQRKLEEEREAQRLLEEEARLLEEEAQRRLKEEREAQRRLEEAQRLLEEEEKHQLEIEARREERAKQQKLLQDYKKSLEELMQSHKESALPEEQPEPTPLPGLVSDLRKKLLLPDEDAGSLFEDPSENKVEPIQENVKHQDLEISDDKHNQLLQPQEEETYPRQSILDKEQRIEPDVKLDKDRFKRDEKIPTQGIDLNERKGDQKASLGDFSRGTDFGQGQRDKAKLMENFSAAKSSNHVPETGGQQDLTYALENEGFLMLFITFSVVFILLILYVVLQYRGKRESQGYKSVLPVTQTSSNFKRKQIGSLSKLV